MPGRLIVATALVAEIGGWKAFIGRNLAAWIGLVPKQQSSGGKDKLGRLASRSTSANPFVRAVSTLMFGGRCRGRLRLQLNLNNAIYHARESP